MSVAVQTAPLIPDVKVDLDEYDEEQVRLMEERCILVTPEDKAYGEDSKKTCRCSLYSTFLSCINWMRPCS